MAREPRWKKKRVGSLQQQVAQLMEQVNNMQATLNQVQAKKTALEARVTQQDLELTQLHGSIPTTGDMINQLVQGVTQALQNQPQQPINVTVQQPVQQQQQQAPPPPAAPLGKDTRVRVQVTI
jgi:uncharacterized protein YlxW (UPF0749 family)